MRKRTSFRSAAADSWSIVFSVCSDLRLSSNCVSSTFFFFLHLLAAMRFFSLLVSFDSPVTDDKDSLEATVLRRFLASRFPGGITAVIIGVSDCGVWVDSVVWFDIGVCLRVRECLRSVTLEPAKAEKMRNEVCWMNLQW